MTSNLLTSTRLKDARACLRLHRHKWIDGYRSTIEPEALRFGSLLHHGLEAWWLTAGDPGRPNGARLDAAIAAMIVERNGIPPDPFDLARAELLMVGYDARWAADDYEVLGVEVPFETELRNPATGAASRTYRLAGKIDAIVCERQSGRVLIVEHKTTGEDAGPGSDYWKRLRLDGQVSIYYAGAAALGYDVAGCLYDVIRKPGQRPGKATPADKRKYRANGDLYATQREADESPDEYRERLVAAVSERIDEFFFRGEVVRLEAELEEAAWDTWLMASLLREATRENRHPRNPDACIRYGRTCEFFAVCSGEASIEDEARYRKVEVLHPELLDEQNGA